MKDQYGNELAALAKLEREHNTQANEAALIAAVEAGYEQAITDSVRASYEEYNAVMDYHSEPKVHEDILAGRAAFRLLLTRHQEREKRLRAFVHRVATTQLGSDEEMMMSMVDCIEEALKLLTELDGDENG